LVFSFSAELLAAPSSLEDSELAAVGFCLESDSGFLIGATGAGAANSDVVFFTDGTMGFWKLFPSEEAMELEPPRPGFLIKAPEDPGKGLLAGAIFSLLGCITMVPNKSFSCTPEIYHLTYLLSQ